MVKHRLKPQQLVDFLFLLFSRNYDAKDVESIFELEIPLEEVTASLEEHYAVAYSDKQWIFTQIRKYENRTGSRLFDKVRKDNALFLRLHRNMRSFSQKKHLYISQKIKVSNGVYDAMSHFSRGDSSQNPVKLFLGAGSTVYHLAKIIAERTTRKDSACFEIHTHNVSVINCLLEAEVNQEKITLFTPGGRVDPVTNAILDPSWGRGNQQDFDFIVLGTSFLKGEELFVEHSEESLTKGQILKESRGNKMLLLTGHEVRPDIQLSISSFGGLSDFNTLIVPNNNAGLTKNIDRFLKAKAEHLVPQIMNWNYRIYKIQSEKPEIRGIGD